MIRPNRGVFARCRYDRVVPPNMNISGLWCAISIPDRRFLFFEKDFSKYPTVEIALTTLGTSFLAFFFYFSSVGSLSFFFFARISFLSCSVIPFLPDFSSSAGVPVLFVLGTSIMSPRLDPWGINFQRSNLWIRQSTHPCMGLACTFG